MESEHRAKKLTKEKPKKQRFITDINKFISNIEKKKIEDYINQKLKEGYTGLMIIKAAKDAGWSERLVKRLLEKARENKTEQIVEELKQVKEFPQKNMEDLQEGDLAEVQGTVVQAFELRFYEACLECNRRVSLEGNKRICPEHGIVTSEYVPILDLLLDDGTDDIMVVCFRDRVAKVLSKTEEQIQKYIENPTRFAPARYKLQGKRFIITGSVTKNEIFDRLELIAHDVTPTD